ncbi:MAG TPA: F0F1 ATP synthase subunit delta [Candidatus Saccharimonadales bacterium]|nr:F0F1 ATP synthase subunit delta [Candidatus Saccharimonadales bacterium]
MKLSLPSSVASSQDLTALLLEVRDYARWVAHESIKKRVDTKGASEPPILSPALTELLRGQGFKKPLDRQNLDELIKALEKYHATAPSITLTLAAPPTSDIKKTLVTWCRENIAPNILVTFQFNTTLLGGMVVRHGSHIFDWSFRRQILAARNQFPEVLRRV